MLTQKFLMPVLVLTIAAGVPAFALSCTTGNPCTGSSLTGSDSTDRTNFESDNTDLTFSNITFDDATGTYTLAGGLDSSSGAALFGVSFIGCFSSQTQCLSNSTGLAVGNVVNWGGGANPALQLNSGVIGGGNFVTFTITLPANTFAFGVDILNQNNANVGAPTLVHVDNTADKSTAAPASLPGSVFFGFRSLAPIGTVTIYSGFNNEQIALDNFEIGGPTVEDSPVAETTTLLLVGSGLVILGFARRRKGLNLLAA